MEILILLGLILLNGIFAMTEMSLVTSKSYKLEKMEAKGNVGAKVAKNLKEHPTKFLSTIQIGITLIGILLGVFSGEKLAGQLSEWMKQNSILTEYSDNIATILIVIIVTYFSILLGELFPKRVGMTYPETIASTFSRPMNWLSQVAKPFVWFLTQSNRILTELFGIKNNGDYIITEEEIRSIIQESVEVGEIQDIEQDIVENVFELGDRKVNTLYTHSSDIVFFSTTESWQEIKTKIDTFKHSAYPVCLENNIDKIEGMVLIKNLFAEGITENFDIRKYMQNALFIDENTLAYNVLELFKEKQIHYGIVVDEFGSTQGIVTMDDLLDALVGDASEMYHEKDEIFQRDEHSWIVDGKFPIIEFGKNFQLSINPKTVPYTTLAGMLIDKKGKIPEVGEKIIIKPYTYEIMDKDGQRIDKILVSKSHEK